jgi:hypothetical protein
MADDHINDTGSNSPGGICKYAPERTSPDMLDRLTKTAPLWLGLLVLLKIIGVSAFSLTTASALITVAPIPVLLGTLVLYEPYFVGAFAALCIWFIIQLWIRGPSARLAIPLISVIALFAILLTPIQVLYLVVLAVAITLLVNYIHASRFRQKYFIPEWFRVTFRRILRRHGDVRYSRGDFPYSRIALSPAGIGAVIVVLLIGIFLILTIDIPWLPAEVVALRQPIAIGLSGQETQRPVVYIISEQSGIVTMLTDDNRQLVSVSSADVGWRRICNFNRLPVSSAPLIWVILGRKTTSPNVACWRLTDDPVEEAKH